MAGNLLRTRDGRMMLNKGLFLFRQPLDVSHTQYGCELALKKQELEAVMDKFNREERDAMRQKLDAMDAEDAIASLEGELGALGAEVTASTDGQISDV